jgi:hypothetical protein
MVTARPYTTHDDRTLRQSQHRGLSQGDAAAALGRSVKSVKARVKRLGIVWRPVIWNDPIYRMLRAHGLPRVEAIAEMRGVRA